MCISFGIDCISCRNEMSGTFPLKGVPHIMIAPLPLCTVEIYIFFQFRYCIFRLWDYKTFKANCVRHVSQDETAYVVLKSFLCVPFRIR